ncbi:MAG TPA: phosphatase PAP2 family protein [Polyangiaceae bacterium LLY-WYZ-15_(1-7)]|nr:phosphatidylglycerophosphatase [Myxococcales bacterium]MAT28437.1 phosphatidylglycerophosphatase [Sandaracinus sp.]HJK93094.1 phosphatase PAP2 family protein [Polyangiaceae bacterium LLY-WYZ-15_(1-7)]MBJ70404.1 phosphatidylglycerophosphatase [Sandaracinus sp.]HJL03846.1 phosphatase PAP2 family protein [Polyangiaceae bacterium LLY-WYZ-15_(1-7)]
MRLPALLLTPLALLFGALGALVEDAPILFDGAWLRLHEALRGPALTAVVRGLTHLGGHEVMVPMCALVTIAAFAARRRTGVFLAAALGGSALLNEGLKMLFARPRPTIVARVYEPRGLSFPSGHSQSTMAFALALFLVVRRLEPGSHAAYRKHAWGLFFLPLVVGWTRTYLGVHYPSDVLAGWTAAALWVLLVDLWYRRAPTGPVPMDSVPTDSVPTDAVPTGSVPTDSVPTGSASTSTAPSAVPDEA